MATYISRKLRSKGFGIHSPFAFDFVTKIIYANTHYYAFDDIHKLLATHGLSDAIRDINFLSFRVINYLKAQNILEVGAQKGINALYITAPSKKTTCLCVERDADNQKTANILLKNWDRNIQFSSTLPKNDSKFDAILLHLHAFSENTKKMIEWMKAHSTQNTCWIFTGIRTKKQHQTFWKQIMKDEHVTVCFDKSDIGIAFLNSAYHKLNYFI